MFEAPNELMHEQVSAGKRQEGANDQTIEDRMHT